VGQEGRTHRLGKANAKLLRLSTVFVKRDEACHARVVLNRVIRILIVSDERRLLKQDVLVLEREQLDDVRGGGDARRCHIQLPGA